MNGIRRLCLTGVAVMVATSVMAGEGEGEKPKGPRHGARMQGAERFKKMDADANGSVSLEEFKAAHEKRVEAMKARMGDKWDAEKAATMPSAGDIFKKMDKDEDGQLTQVEMRKAYNKRMKRTDRKRRKVESADDDD